MKGRAVPLCLANRKKKGYAKVGTEGAIRREGEIGGEKEVLKGLETELPYYIDGDLKLEGLSQRPAACFTNQNNGLFVVTWDPLTRE